MANTKIQIRRSTTSATPTGGALLTGELAHSYSSNVLFIGTSDGSGILPLGGKFYVDKTNSSFDIAVAAFVAANSAGTSDSLAAAFDQANSAQTIAISAFTQANNVGGAVTTANNIAIAAFGQANTATTIGSAAFGQANTATTIGSAAFNQANNVGGALTTANTNIVTAHNRANSAFTQANLAFVQANTATTIGSAAFGQANTATTIGSAAFDKANSAQTIAVAAFTDSNTKLSASGGFITGDLSISGNLTITGNTVFKDVETFKVSDPLIYLAANNFGSDIVDIGFIGAYANTEGANVYTGLFRNHLDQDYYLFFGYDQEPTDNRIDPTGNNFTIATLNANIKTSNLVLNGTNVASWITAAFGQANTAATIGSAAFNQANNVGGALTTANTNIVTAHNRANSAFTQANLAFVQANTATTIGSAAFGQANTATTIGSAAFGQANTATTIGSAAFGQANLAFAQANSVGSALTTANGNITAAFNQANTATTIGSAAFGRGNTAQTIAIAAFTQANTAAQSVNLANASGVLAITNGGTNQTSFTNGQLIVFNGTSLASRANGGVVGTFANASHVPVFTTDAYGFITAVTNTAISISASQITSGTLGVDRGGTGNTTFTSKGVLFGNGTGAILVTAAGAEGKVLQADSSGTPIFSDLDGGSF
jgi:trimeric autotransporter adhesin